MKYMPMDKELIAINQIKDLVSVHFEDMYLSGYSGKARIVPGFSIHYGHNQYMILTTLDRHFKEFVERLRKVYQEEKDHVVSRNFLGEQKIQIDELSKSILLSGELEQISDLYNHYENSHGYDQSLIFEIDRINAIIDIAKYHLQLFLLNFKKHFDNFLTTPQEITLLTERYILRAANRDIAAKRSLSLRRVQMVIKTAKEKLSRRLDQKSFA